MLLSSLPASPLCLCFLATDLAVVLLYGGPDTVMPLASALAAVIGVLLMIWNRVFMLIRRTIQSLRRRTVKSRSHHPPSSALHRVTVRDHSN